MSKPKKYNVLSLSSLKQLQEDLEKYSDSLTYKAQRLAEELAEQGVKDAKIHIADFNAMFRGDLYNSIHSESVMDTKYGAVFAIVADDESAIFVEMGTGLIGAKHPYPGKLPAMYAQGVYGKANFKRTGKYYWFYQGTDGNWYYCEGMPSRPFMYETTLDLYKIVEKTAKKVFGE
jgi:hypothetical protein